MSSAKKKRLDIQALRAIAIVSVVIYHLWPEKLTGGFMGVDVFFVISGYLMTTTLMRDVGPVLEAKNKIRATWKYLSDFYARRIKRLVPAASVALLATLGLVIATNNLDLIARTANQVTASALFYQNWQLVDEATDYLSSAKPPTALQHFWSLSIEEQFYLVWPLMLLATLFVTLNIFIVRNKTKLPGAVIPIFLLTVVSFIYGYQLTKGDPAAAYFVTQARVWELLMGAIIAFLPAIKSYDLRLLMPWFGLSLIAYALYRWDGSNFPGWHALIPTIGTALIIYGSSHLSESKFSFNSLFRFQPIQWIGNLSYSLYLWHWPLIILLPVLFEFDLDDHPQSTLLKIMIAVMSVMLGWLSYKFIEIPAQRLQLKKLWVYVAFVVIVGGIASAGYIVSSKATTSAEQQVAALHEEARDKSNICLGARALIDTSKCNENFGAINPAYEKIGRDDIFLNIIGRDKGRCPRFDPMRTANSNPAVYCDIGDIKSNKQIILFGDSHGMHWLNAFNDIGKRNGVKFRVLGTYHCFGLKQWEKSCKKRFDFIRESKVVDKSTAVIISAWARYDAKHKIQPTSIAIKAIQDASTQDIPIYLLEDVPIAGDKGGPDCAIKNLSCNNSVKKSLSDIKAISARIVNEKLLDKSHIIETDDMFCDNSKCYSFIGGIPVYFDYDERTEEQRDQIGGNGHLSATYSLTTSTLLENKFKQQGILK